MRIATGSRAFVVGSNTGEGVRAAPLRFADDDAIAIHELLLEAGVESVLLTTPDADTARLHKDTRPLAPARSQLTHAGK